MDLNEKNPQSPSPKKRPASSSKTSKANNKRRRDDGSDDGQCKTCSYCRVKKMKCDSMRPRCKACELNDIKCEYPRDTRRLTRPSQGRLDDLEQKIAGIWDFISAANTLARTPAAFSAPVPGDAVSSNLDFAHFDGSAGATSSGVDISHPHNVEAQFMSQPEGSSAHEPNPHHWSLKTSNPLPSTDGVTQSLNHRKGSVAGSLAFSPTNVPTASYTGAVGEGDEHLQTNLSPREARIAGLDVGQDGVISVHGPSSMMHHEGKADSGHEDRQHEKTNLKASKARLISYAVIQRQSESFMYANPSSTIDFDGVEPELARHLLDLHWNRQHYAYLLTYRPAVMDSLANGGPWCNKLLLNGMYYTSCLYSDRESLRKTPEDTQSAGDRFYHRFRSLLVDEIMRPSLPSAAALLLTGAALVSQGRISAGWNFCGLGYRMITDMGCHIAINARGGVAGDPGRELSNDIESEWRRRLYWGALITDATQSMYLGRPMSLRFGEGRVPQLFLDTYEELEEWRPYVDEIQPPPDNDLLLAYRPKPAFAISTFTGLIRLAQISSMITQTFYSLECINTSHDDFMRRKSALEEDLARWKADLPAHLQFRAGHDPTPCPHQITPFTTYHVLNILLRRPFLEGGHLQDHTTPSARSTLEQHCISSALEIQKLISSYRDAFTLRRAPFLISYAVYSAVIVILRHGKRDLEHFNESISFFLTALSELQRNCNYGLRKPMAIIKKMFSELKDCAPRPADDNGVQANAMFYPDLAEFPAIFSDPLELPTDYSMEWAQPSFDVSPEGFFDFDQAGALPDDSLYGLLAFQAPAF